MNNLQRQRVTRMKKLHSEIVATVRTTLNIAIELGGLLEEQKAETQHGGWTAWVENNLPFDIRTAQNYMAAFRRRGELKNETVSYLADAYRVRKEPKSVAVADKQEQPEMESPPAPAEPAPDEPYFDLRRRFDLLRDEIQAAFVKTVKIAAKTDKSADYMAGVEAVALELMGTLSMRETLDFIKQNRKKGRGGS